MVFFSLIVCHVPPTPPQNRFLRYSSHVLSFHLHFGFIFELLYRLVHFVYKLCFLHDFRLNPLILPFGSNIEMKIHSIQFNLEFNSSFTCLILLFTFRISCLSSSGKFNSEIWGKKTFK